MLRRAITVLVVALTFGSRAVPSAVAHADRDPCQLHAPVATAAHVSAPGHGLGVALVVAPSGVAAPPVASLDERREAPRSLARAASRADRARAPPAAA